ncbi:MAG: CopG family transcriptional regulator [Bacteroidota bacterium]
MLNVRLNSDEEKKLADYCERANLTKSQVVKEALALYLSSKTPSKSAYELGEDLFGQASGGDPDGSKQYKHRLKTKWGEKHTH